MDTAGLRQTLDEVERAGLEQGEDLVRSADLVCLVFDRSEELDQEVRELALGLGPHKLLAVSNKQDLPQAQGAPEDWFAEQGFAWVGVSASTGQGMDRLVQAIRDMIVGRVPEPKGQELVPNLRQRDLLDRVMQALEEASQALASGMPPDVVLVSVQEAVNRLGEITGEISTEDILDRIFSQFCIGK